MKLGGVIYLQNVAEKRLKGTTRRNFDMFRRLCGDRAGEVSEDVSGRRELQLRTKFMFRFGSSMHRFNNSQQSALSFLEHILSKQEASIPLRFDDDARLRMQQELVELSDISPRPRQEWNFAT
jgi:hypothetical protein